MARVDLKGLKKRLDALHGAASGYHDFPDDVDIRIKLQRAAIEFTKVCITGYDGVDSTEAAELLDGLRCGANEFAGAFDLVKREPLKHIFELAAMSAATQKTTCKPTRKKVRRG